MDEHLRKNLEVAVRVFSTHALRDWSAALGDATFGDDLAQYSKDVVTQDDRAKAKSGSENGFDTPLSVAVARQAEPEALERELSEREKSERESTELLLSEHERVIGIFGCMAKACGDTIGFELVIEQAKAA